MILLRLFKNNRTGGMAGLVVMVLAIFLKTFIQVGATGIVEYSAMPFYNLVFGAIHTTPILNRVISLLLLISYMLIRIAARYVLLEFRSFMPAFFFLMFSVALPSTQHVNPALVASIFYLLSFAVLFDVHDKRPNSFSIFTASLVLVLGSMFYLKLIWFLPLIWISLATLRSVTWRELLFPVTAYVLLGIFLIAWYWGVLNDSERLLNLLKNNLAFNSSFSPYHFSVYLYYGFYLMVVIIASVFMVNRFQTRKTVIQNIYQVKFFMFLAGILFFLFVARFEETTLIFIAFPVSFILANYFHRKKNHWAHEMVLWILFGLLVFTQVMF